MAHAPTPARRGRRGLVAAALTTLAAGGIGLGIANASTTESPAQLAAAVAAPTSGSSTAPGTSTAGGTSTVAPKPRPEHRPRLSGTVTASTAATITIKDFDGFTRVILTSFGTTFSDGLTMPVAVGTKVVATGSVDADGVRLDATTVAKAPADGGWGGPGRGGGPRGRGGPGGPGMGAPPTGTNVPAPPTGTDHPAPPTGGPRPTGAPAPSSASSAPTTAGSTG